MVDREHLLTRTRRAYELGRWHMAARVLAIIVPIAVVCIALTERPLVCIGLAVLLGAAAVVLRWRDRRGVRVTNVGLTAGLLPLAAGIAVSQLGSMSSPAVCMGICIASGLLAGAWAGYMLRGSRGALDWLTVGAVATVTALLGCIDLDRSSLVALMIALFASGVVASLLAKRPSVPDSTTP